MTSEETPAATVDGVDHHLVEVGTTRLHYVSAGSSGSPVLLVHGFPETWWAFHRLIPLLATEHRVFAVDLRGFGESDVAADDHDSRTAADDLHGLIAQLGVGPVHVVSQDISGGAVFRLIAAHPSDVRSLTAVETGLAGFGLEGLADVTHGGSWHIGALAAPGVPELLFTGRERELIGGMLRAMSVDPGAVTAADVDELARTYARPGGWRGASGLYRSMLAEGEELRALAAARPVPVPVLAVGAGGGAFTADTMTQVAAGTVATESLDGVGHYAALEAPTALAVALRGFLERVDAE
ncbi:alpha/beta fold hydrolase [Microbacterium marinilacus]|uniref:Alpha/beta hydrolase n=1 Tax=Microbacterium marinilacus TaxID=415209 RepID=A0ABP7BIC0_9MICO|nr:alpha/beta hydrolase [Microbacterium marinilacus]MBY0689790.1 alpha/beta hydrolase [Microbacterium marinilacus]